MKLNIGEVLCSSCHGVDNTSKYYKYKTVCKKCNGTGKLDWIKDITGESHNPETEDQFAHLLKVSYGIWRLYGTKTW